MNFKIEYPKEPDRPIPKPGKMSHEAKEKEKLPKGSLWFTHDPAIFKDPVSKSYYVYSTGAICQKSTDLIHWSMVGKVVEEPPKESVDWVKTKDIWAPDIVKVGGEYRLYCSNSSWGVRQSAIFLAVSESPEGPFEPRGVVLKTTDEMPVNAIDANIVTNALTGQQYLLYGSFWGGCHMLKLDTETGMAAESGIGVCVARRPEWFDTAVEGPYIRYNHENGYYYLFVSYGSLANDYNIRVGRSKNITGPYLDHNGRKMTDTEDCDNTVGFMMQCGYQFDDSVGFMAPGHNSVLEDGDGRWYLVSHIREHNFKSGEPSTMHVRRILWSVNDWPMVVPEIYSGERQQPLTKELVQGNYERIRLCPMVPQGVLSSVPMELREDGTFMSCSVKGTWQMTGDTTVEIRYADKVEQLTFIPVWDQEQWKPNLAFTGIDNKGIAVFGKKW